jgi:hypothetical protein
MEELPKRKEPKPEESRSEELTPEEKEEYERLKLTPEGRYKILTSDKFFKIRVLELCSDEEKKEIENLKNKLGWKELPYKNLEELIRWVNFPENASKESIRLIKLIGDKVCKELINIEHITKSYEIGFKIKRLEHVFTI